MDSLETWIASKSKDAHCDTLVPIGEIIGPWKVVALLGKGGSAEVYRVQHTHHNVSAALKIILSTDERARERFARERELLKIQTLTCFARFIDSGEWSGRPFIVTEELESFELPHKDPAVTKFILAVCNAVALLHAEGYVHRDLKPGNIMRRKDGSYVLIDLGLVKKIEGESLSRPKSDSLSIVDGQKVVVGTPGYSAPEQFISGDASVESDIHAVGVIINECFDGKPNQLWARLVEKSTSSIPAQRYKSIKDLVNGVSIASSIMPKAGKLTLLVAYIPLMACLIWCIVRSFQLHFQYGANSSQIGYFIGQMLCFSALESIIPLGLTFRQSWARWLAITVGGIFLLYLISSPWIENGIQNQNAWGVAAFILGFLPITILGALLYIPTVSKWYRREIL